DDQQTAFADALDRFSHKIWRSPKARKQYRYDLAILANKDEKLPPSDAKAIKRFIKEGNRLGIDVDIIDRKDYVRNHRHRPSYFSLCQKSRIRRHGGDR
ncbi:MAG: hypothetical protein ACPGZU_18430, partial [Ketobacter sp.]